MAIIHTKEMGISKLSKSQLLKKELNSKELSFLMEAHNGLTAKIVEASGFKEYGHLAYPYQLLWESEIVMKHLGLKF